MAPRQLSSRTQTERTEAAKASIRIAALELFALHGYEAATLADISLRAGYSRALAQYHYGEKSALAVELLEARMRRDLHADMLICPPGTPAATVWSRLLDHLDASWEQYRQVHGKGVESLRVRGEVVLQQAATGSSDRKMADRLNALTAILVSRVAHALEICREAGFLRSEVDVQGVAVFYVHAIWGLASALFANPKGEPQLVAAVGVLRQMLEGLRTTSAAR
jgi:AcrR family transcriptional regulator